MARRFQWQWITWFPSESNASKAMVQCVVHAEKSELPDVIWPALETPCTVESFQLYRVGFLNNPQGIHSSPVPRWNMKKVNGTSGLTMAHGISRSCLISTFRARLLELSFVSFSICGTDVLKTCVLDWHLARWQCRVVLIIVMFPIWMPYWCSHVLRGDEAVTILQFVKQGLILTTPTTSTTLLETGMRGWEITI